MHEHWMGHGLKKSWWHSFENMENLEEKNGKIKEKNRKIYPGYLGKMNWYSVVNFSWNKISNFSDFYFWVLSISKLTTKIFFAFF